MGKKSTVISLRIPLELAMALDQVVAEGNYDSRSEAIRDAIRHFLAARRPKSSP
jgi:metal-responsive CopG/Arc/MetJ family transcriptional regulator